MNVKKTLPTATETTAAVELSQSYPPLDQECRSSVDTACAAYHLNRAPQTMRAWACMENGPLRPVRINDRLVRDGAIVVPVCGPDGGLQSLQFIYPDGKKRFLSGTRMRHGRLFLGDPVSDEPITLCEGWATGCSLHEAKGSTIVVCFSGANLVQVADDLRNQFPDAILQIAADRDAHGKGVWLIWKVYDSARHCKVLAAQSKWDCGRKSSSACSRRPRRRSTF